MLSLTMSDAAAERIFNTAGAMRPEDHYCIPPLSRLGREELLTLIRRQQYFVLYAPRHSGKTSTLRALRDLLNGGAEGAYRCVYVDLDVCRYARADLDAAMRAILIEIADEAEATLEDRFPAEIWPEELELVGPLGALQGVLGRWAEADPKPLVLLIDEIDAMIGDPLSSMLRQLRSGFIDRPRRFPQSVVLCGVGDVRDYRTGGSGFNITAKSLRMPDFSEPEVRALLAQHTAETGQPWTEEAQRTVWELTAGQPWLVNALAYLACSRDPAGRDRSRPLTADAIHAAREKIIRRRDVPLDRITNKLEDERVHRVLSPLLSGAMFAPDIGPDDLRYARDLGLVTLDAPVRVANPIYREAIPRHLTFVTQAMLTHDPARYRDAAGNLLLADLLAAFQEFFREHSEHWIEQFQYREAGPELLLQGFLQRMVNDGGRIEREYGLGMMRTDLLIVWPATAAAGRQRKMVVECRVLHRSPERTIEEGLAQTRAYLDRCGAAEGHLVIFDRTPDRPWEQKLFRREATGAGPPITTWGM